MGQHLRDVALRFHRIDARKVQLQGLCAELLDGGLIQARREIVANLLLRCVATVLLAGKLVEDSPEIALVILRELAVHAPPRLVGRDRVFLHPSATGVLIEVHAGLRGFVHRIHVEARRVRKRISGRSGVCANAMQNEDATADTSMASLRMAAFREWPEDRRFNHKILPIGVGSGGDSRLAIRGVNAPTAPCIRKRNSHTLE